MTSRSAEPQTVGELGEFPLINLVTRNLSLPPAVSLGPGDDCAAYLINGSALTTTDMLIEGVHFRRNWSSAADIGHKSVAVNLADIEAMGGTPIAMVISLGLPADLPVTWVREFMTGVREEAELGEVALVGGDMTAARDISISVTVIGETGGRTPVLRSGAKPGNVVAVRGRLGWAAAGLAALARGFRSPRAAVDAQRMPHVPYGAGRQAADAGATAMLDVSDGLLADLGHIAEASSVTIDLDSSRFTIADPVQAVASALNADPLGFVLGGGEDHAMAATFEPGDVPEDWDVIGVVHELDEEAGPCVLVDGKQWEGDQGWTHFRS
ncbi:thiamine-phosphate kinase [Propionimicrobium sp. PCR01-08-3]|uniref:thiamine-phosphate kinase n=1 Tax=Propionimicrobium sp. PCR01-08-3 TaxID=3052086 RepID=UPI00255D0205|nr:thiamine-phosphate kinase [Propionimicrobium sp. PCR01-08-3]WIY83637.1 thiamine-phosphate kinase [Propionimicrobium sp. PCR01-08-3]